MLGAQFTLPVPGFFYPNFLCALSRTVRKSVHIAKDLISLIIVAIHHTNQADAKTSWADSDGNHSVPGGFLMRLWSQRGFPLSFRVPRNDLKTLKNSPDSLSGPASHNSARQPALIFLHGGALFPEVHTQIQVAATVPEEMLAGGQKAVTRYYRPLSSTSDGSSLSSHPQKVWSHQSTWCISTPLTHYQSIN